jgi:hypothetical protein
MNEIPAPPPPVDNGRLGYVQREKIFIKLSVARSKALKKKEKKNNSLAKTEAIAVVLNNVNLQIDENLLASLNSSGARTSIASSIDATLTVESDGHLEPIIKTIIIIVIFTHREIWVGCVISLHYLVYIIIL